MNKDIHSSEEQYRQAFIRLKENKPKILPKGSKVTQNNVSKEAGSTSTAMRKDRYPDLIRDIQDYINQTPKVETSQKKIEKLKQKHRELVSSQKAVELIQDQNTSRFLSLFIEIAHLRKRVISLEKELNRNSVTSIYK